MAKFELVSREGEELAKQRKEALSLALAKACCAYSRSMTPETLAVYYEALEDVDPQNLADGMLWHLRFSKWWPTPADLRRKAERFAAIYRNTKYQAEQEGLEEEDFIARCRAKILSEKPRDE